MSDSIFQTIDSTAAGLASHLSRLRQDVRKVEELVERRNAVIEQLWEAAVPAMHQLNSAATYPEGEADTPSRREAFHVLAERLRVAIAAAEALKR